MCKEDNKSSFKLINFLLSIIIILVICHWVFLTNVVINNKEYERKIDKLQNEVYELKLENGFLKKKGGVEHGNEKKKI